MKIYIIIIVYLFTPYCFYAQSLNMVFSASTNKYIANIAITQDSTVFINEMELCENSEQVSRLYKSFNGLDWSMIWSRRSDKNIHSNPTYYYLKGISPKNKDTISMSNIYNISYTSFDGGISWDSSSTHEILDSRIIDYQKNKNEVLIVVENSHTFFYSNNYGLTWDAIKTKIMPYPPMPENAVLEGNGDFIVSESDNYGTILFEYRNSEWSIIDTIDLFPKTIKKLNNNKYLVTNKYLLDVVEIDGTKYQYYSYELFDEELKYQGSYFNRWVKEGDYFCSTVESFDNKVMLTCNDTIWISDDDGNSWNHIEKDTQEPMENLYLKNSDLLDNGLGVYHDQKAVYLYNPNPTSVEELSEKDNTISIFPNPSAGIFTVSNEESGLQGIKVFDSQGNEVGNLDVSSRSQDLSYLSSGTYFLRFNYKDKVKIRQIVINR